MTLCLHWEKRGEFDGHFLVDGLHGLVVVKALFWMDRWMHGLSGRILAWENLRIPPFRRHFIYIKARL